MTKILKCTAERTTEIKVWCPDHSTVYVNEFKNVLLDMDAQALLLYSYISVYSSIANCMIFLCLLNAPDYLQMHTIFA